jgi:hypothetical protein
MDRLYTPKVGALTAHQIGMATGIAIVALLAYVITFFLRPHCWSDRPCIRREAAEGPGHGRAGGGNPCPHGLRA